MSSGLVNARNFFILIPGEHELEKNYNVGNVQLFTLVVLCNSMTSEGISNVN